MAGYLRMKAASKSLTLDTLGWNGSNRLLHGSDELGDFAVTEERRARRMTDRDTLPEMTVPCAPEALLV